MSGLFVRMSDYHQSLAAMAAYRCAMHSDTPGHYGELCSVSWLDANNRELLRYTPEFGFSDTMRGRQWGSLGGYRTTFSKDGFNLTIDYEVKKF